MINNEVNDLVEEEDDGLEDFFNSDSLPNEDGSINLTTLDILARLETAEDNELILTVPSDLVNDIKQSLIKRKAKRNQFLRDKGLSVEKSSLGFNLLEDKLTEEEKEAGLMKLQITLSFPKTYPIFKIETPTGL